MGLLSFILFMLFVVYPAEKLIISSNGPYMTLLFNYSFCFLYEDTEFEFSSNVLTFICFLFFFFDPEEE